MRRFRSSPGVSDGPSPAPVRTENENRTIFAARHGPRGRWPSFVRHQSRSLYGARCVAWCVARPAAPTYPAERYSYGGLTIEPVHLGDRTGRRDRRRCAVVRRAAPRPRGAGGYHNGGLVLLVRSSKLVILRRPREPFCVPGAAEVRSEGKGSDDGDKEGGRRYQAIGK